MDRAVLCTHSTIFNCHLSTFFAVRTINFAKSNEQANALMFLHTLVQVFLHLF